MGRESSITQEDLCMGRRKGKRTVFLQGGTLEQEAQLNIHSEDEAGGLHIGSAVVYRAPLSARRVPGRPARPQQSGRPGTGGCFPAQQQQDADEWQSEGSLDDELWEYLDNVEQHDEGSDSEPTNTPQQQQSAPDLSAAGTSTQCTGPTTTAGGVQAPAKCKWSLGYTDDDAGIVSRPGLGYHPGLGFSSSAAAARFTAVGLDDALEGMLGQDLAAGLGCSSNSSQSHTDSSSKNTDDDSSSSSSSGGGDSDEDVVPDASFHSKLIDASGVVVVTSQGEAVAAWEQLSLQQRYPVMTRQQQQQQSLAAPGLGLANSSSRHRSNSGREASKQQHKRTHHHNSVSGNTNTPTPAAASWASSIRMPSFRSAATTAAATAACAAAAEAADASAAQRQRDHKLRQQQRSGIKGARNGQLLPGEKKKLRKEKIAAKRAVRRAEAGCSALELLGVIEEFVAGGGDMTVLPPAGKHKQAFTRALASVFGVKTTPQGGSRSGKTSLILQSTSSTALLSEDDGVQLKQLRDLLSAEVAQELTAAAVAAGYAAGSAQKKTKSRVSQRQGLQQQSSRGTNANANMSAFQQPVSFVSAGVCNPNDMTAIAVAIQGQRDYVSVAADTPVPAQVAAARHPASASSGAAADSSGQCSSSTAAKDVGAVLAALLLDLDHDQQQQDGNSTAAAGAQPADAQISDNKQQQLQQHTLELTAGAWVVDREAQPAAVVTSAVPEYTEKPQCNSAAIAAAVNGPVYQRTATGLGFGSGSSSTPGVGLGFVASSSGALQAGNAEVSSHPAAATATAGIQCQFGGGVTYPTEGAARQQRISNGSKVLQDLEHKFSNLRAASNPHATCRQQRNEHKAQQQAGLHQQQQQRQLERRLSNPDTSVGPTVMAGVGQHDVDGANLGPYHDLEGHQEQYPVTSSMTLGLTAQQVKKAKKQKQRNQRREAKAAGPDGVADALDHVYDAGVGVNLGNVSNSFAGFEAHTSGIGSRLLGRWGWSEGEGLGRSRHGRAEPLQAARRPRQLGLGAE